MNNILQFTNYIKAAEVKECSMNVAALEDTEYVKYKFILIVYANFSQWRKAY